MYGEKYGCMTADELLKGIKDSRNNNSVKHLNSGEHQFLKSIVSTCGRLPHSNEACMDARRTYISYLMQFGIPIKHLFKWDTKTQESNDVGLFGEVVAWCLAAKEQGQKSLHGHYLVFIKDWNQVMNVLQQMEAEDNNNSEKPTQLTYKDACGEAKAMFLNASSARLFSDFTTGKPLSQTPVPS
jgi:hypothetical protein